MESTRCPIVGTTVISREWPWIARKSLRFVQNWNRFFRPPPLSKLFTQVLFDQRTECGKLALMSLFSLRGIQLLPLLHEEYVGQVEAM